MKTIIVIICIVLGALLMWSAVPAHSQGVTMITPHQCNLTEAMLKGLSENYKEVAIGGGISSKGYQVRLFVSKSNTFTVLETRPGGISCINSAGDDWTMAPPEKPGEHL